MAGVLFAAQSPKIATGVAAKTILQLVAATNTRIKLKEWSISFDGTSNTATPLLVELVRQTSAGTMTALTLRKINNSDAETLQSTSQHTATAEPTDASDVPYTELIHPQTGYTWQAPFGGEIIVKGGERLGLRVTAAATVNAEARFVGEE